MTELGMAERTAVAVTPDSKVLARRPGRELFPSSWVKRSVRIEYEVAGQRENTRGVLQDFCSVGILLGANGTRLLVSWDALRTVELKND
jgi:hypothetical protein